MNAHAIIRNPNRKDSGVASDGVHPNQRGMGEIAQEFFMKMSLSPAFLAKQSLLLQGQDQVYNNAL